MEVFCAKWGYLGSGNSGQWSGISGQGSVNRLARAGVESKATYDRADLGREVR